MEKLPLVEEFPLILLKTDKEILVADIESNKTIKLFDSIFHDH